MDGGGHLEDSLELFDTALKSVEEKLEPVLSLLSEKHGEGTAREAPLDEAENLVALAYTLNSLFFMFLRTAGVDASKHPVREELDRVKSVYLKVKAMKKADGTSLGDPVALDGEDTRMRVNEAGARRVIASALEDAPPDVKKKVLKSQKKAKQKSDVDNDVGSEGRADKNTRKRKH